MAALCCEGISGNSTDDWNLTANLPWMNTDILRFAEEIESAVLVLHGKKAHSRYMGEAVFEPATEAFRPTLPL